MALPPDTRDMQLDLLDAFFQRQVRRIKRQFATQEKRRAKRQEFDLRDQPDHWQSRGHAMGPRRPSLSEIDGDERDE